MVPGIESNYCTVLEVHYASSTIETTTSILISIACLTGRLMEDSNRTQLASVEHKAGSTAYTCSSFSRGARKPDGFAVQPPMQKQSPTTPLWASSVSPLLSPRCLLQEFYCSEPKKPEKQNYKNWPHEKLENLYKPCMVSFAHAGMHTNPHEDRAGLIGHYGDYQANSFWVHLESMELSLPQEDKSISDSSSTSEYEEVD